MLRPVTALALLPLVLLTGCGSEPAARATAAGSSGTRIAADAPSASARYGTTVTLADGLALSTSVPKVFIYEDGDGDGLTYLVAEVTLHNGSTVPVAPSAVTVKATEGGAPLNPTMDSSVGIEMPPTTPVAPGATTRWKVGYGAHQAHALTIALRPKGAATTVTFHS